MRSLPPSGKIGAGQARTSTNIGLGLKKLGQTIALGRQLGSARCSFGYPDQPRKLGGGFAAEIWWSSIP